MKIHLNPCATCLSMKYICYALAANFPFHDISDILKVIILHISIYAYVDLLPLICTRRCDTEVGNIFPDVSIFVCDSDTHRSGISDVILNCHDSPCHHVPGHHEAVWKFHLWLYF